jgi:DNA-binding CsgD family transcriptional regulator
VRSLGVARLSGDDTMIGAALINLGSGAGEVREYAVAEPWLRECIDWCSAHDLDGYANYGRAYLARVHFERGEWSQAAEILERGALADYSCALVLRLTVLGRLRSRRGEPRAEEALEEAWALAEQIGDLQTLWPVAAGHAEHAWLEGRPVDDRVREVYKLAVERDHQWAIGEIGQWLESELDGLPQSAALPYRLAPMEAARAWEERDCPYEAALALMKSPDHLHEALRGFERLGAHPAADRVARMLRDRGLRAPRRFTLAHPDGLTERQADVLALLREGLRNADIAERLHIAEKTVDHHVSAILAKLGVRSRREAAQHGEIANRRWGAAPDVTHRRPIEA